MSPGNALLAVRGKWQLEHTGPPSAVKCGDGISSTPGNPIPSNFDDICATCYATTAHNNQAMTGRHNEGADCTTCHPHEHDGTNETADGFMPKGSCTSCHSQPQDNGDGVPAGGRRAVLGEFGKRSHHVAGTVTDADCVVCHDQSTHTDGYVDLYPPDGGESIIYDGSPETLGPFCAGCHDGDGATRLGDQALSPFSDGLAPPAVSVHSNAAFTGRAEEPFDYVTCANCHQTHGSDNIYLANQIVTLRGEVESEDVVFTALTGPDSFDEDTGDPTDTDDVCVTCHINPGTPGYPMSRHAGGQHSTFDQRNQDCTMCHRHDRDGSPVTPDGFMPPATDAASGPDCVSCHDLGGIAPSHVDVSTLQNGIHANLGNPADAPNSACWTCHGDGSRPSGHPANYKNPKLCTDCHAGQVAEHFRSGQDIRAATNTASDLASCLACHQEVADMRLSNRDPDAGSFDADQDGTQGGSISAYHYGRQRIIDCSYCHQNQSEFAPVFTDAQHMQMGSHPKAGHEGPQCTECHGNDNLHSSALQKPAATIAFCQACHSREQHNIRVTLESPSP